MSNLILCGFKGAGKTTFGKQLAKQLGLPFIDTDELIEKREGMHKRELYLLDNGSTFRKIEQQTIASLVDTTNHVIAIGGGTLCDPMNVQLLINLGQLLYLKVDKETIQERIATDFFHNFDKVFEERSLLFESLPVITLKGVLDGE